jgi:hypothetical protein
MPFVAAGAFVAGGAATGVTAGSAAQTAVPAVKSKKIKAQCTVLLFINVRIASPVPVGL